MSPRTFPLLLAVALAAAPGPARAAEKLSLAVMDLQGEDPAEAAMFSGLVAAELHRLGLFDIVATSDVRGMLELEKQKTLLGCADASCLAEISGALGVKRMVAGSLARIDTSVVLTLVYIDLKRTKVLGRVAHRAEPKRLADELEGVVRELVKEDLAASASAVAVVVSEPGAEIWVDGALLGTSPLAQQKLVAGRHEVRVKKAGFVEFAAPLALSPNQPQTLRADLFPSPELVRDYNTGARRRRIAAWTLGGVATVAAGASLYFGLQYLDGAARYDALDRERLADPTFALKSRDEYRRNFQAVIDETEGSRSFGYVTFGTALAAAGGSLYLFVTGDDPDRYAAFGEAE